MLGAFNRLFISFNKEGVGHIPKSVDTRAVLS